MDELWKCEACERIGTRDQATHHSQKTGHMTEKLPDHIAEAVRAEWRKAGRSEVDGAPKPGSDK